MTTLSNGKRVANFSSPHDFTFEDGSILTAMDEEGSKRLSVNFHEDIDEDGDIKLSFTLSNAVIEQIQEWMGFYQTGVVDIVFCPLPMITAMKESGWDLKRTPFRAVRMTDRVKKLVSISKQCI